MNSSRHAGALIRIGLAAIICSQASWESQLRAANYYWDTNTTGLWSTGTNWSLSSYGLPAGSSVPTSTDTAVFNGTLFFNPTTVQINSPTSIAGLIFTNSGTTLLDSSASSQILSIGAAGLTINSGAGAVTLGNATSVMNITLGSTQSWFNNSTSALTVVNGVSGSASSGTQTLTVAGLGNSTIAGVIGDGSLGGALGLAKSGLGTLTLTGANTFSGPTSISGGTLLLDFSAAGAPSSGGIINNAAVSAVTANSALQLGSGTLSIKGLASAADTQYFAGTSLTGGAATITLTQNGASALTIALGAMTRTAGTLNFNIVPSTSGVIATTSTANDPTGILGDWITVGANATLQYAAVNGGGQIVGYGGATAATANLANVNSATTNYTYSGTQSAANVTANTLRYTGATATTTIATGDTLTVNGLLNAGTGNWSIAPSGTGSVVIGASKELVIQNNTTTTANTDQFIIITAVIKDNPGGPSSVTVAGGSVFAGYAPQAAFTYSGGTHLAGGMTQVNINSAPTGATGSSVTSGPFGTGIVYLDGGALQVTANGNNTFGNTVDITADTVIKQRSTSSSAQTSTLNFTGPITLLNGSHTITITQVFATSTNNAVFAGSVGDGGLGYGLVLGSGSAATGTLLLSGNNTFTGGVTINGGVLKLGNAGALNSTAGSQNAVAFGAAGTMSLNGNNVVISNLTGSAAGTIVQDASATSATLTVGNSTNASGTYAGVIQNGTGAGTLALTQAGSGTLVLAGTNTFTGGLNINSGAIQLGTRSGASVGSLAAATAVTLGSGSGSGVFILGDLSNPVNQAVAGLLISGTGTSNAVVGGNAAISTLTVNSAAGETCTGILGGAGTNQNNLALTSAGAGVLTLAAVNTYAGPTTIQNGTLQLGLAGALPTGTGLTLGAGANSGVLDLNGFNATVTSLTAAGTGTSNVVGNSNTTPGANSTLTFAGGTSTFAGTIQDSTPSGGGVNQVNLQINGGSLTLAASNTYSGTTIINSGASLFAQGGTTQNSPVTVAGGGAFGVTNPTSTSTTTLSSNLTFGAVTTDHTFLNLTAATDWSSSSPPLLFVSGSLTANGGAHSTTINISSPATLIVGSTYNLISYNGAIGGTGFGAFVLGTLPSPRIIANLSNGGSMVQLVVTGTDSPKWEGNILSSGQAIWDINTTANWQLIHNGTQTTYLQGDAVTFDDTATGLTSVTLPVGVTPSSVSFKNNSLPYSVSGSGSIGGNATTLTLSGGGAVTLATVNNYGGTTTVSSGQLNINYGVSTDPTHSAIGQGALVIGANATISNTSGGSVTLGTNNAQTWLGNFTFGGNNPLNLGAGAVAMQASAQITVNGANPLTVGGAIGDTIGGVSQGYALTVTGAGQLILNGNNTYSGPTTINGGMLTLGGTNATSSVTLNTGQLNINVDGAIGGGALTIGPGTTIDNTSGAAVSLTANSPLFLPASFTFGGSNSLNLGGGAATMSQNLLVTTNGAAALTIGGAISDNGNGFNITKAGTGTLVLNGTNTFTGNVFINQGVFSITNAFALNSATVNIAGGTFNIGYLGTLAPNIASNPISVAMGQTGIFDVTGSGAAGNNLTVVTGPITINGSLTFTRNNGGNGTVNFNAPISGNGTMYIGNTNAGQAPAAGNLGRAEFLNASNFTNFFGDFHVLNGGNFAFPSTLSGEGGIVNNNNVTIDAGGYMSVNGTTPSPSTTLIGGLSGAGSVTTNVTTGGMAFLSVGGGDANGNFSGVLSQSLLQATSNLYLIKTGAGTQILTGVSTYSGGTTINGGLLSFANGSLGTGPVIFGGNSTLQWNGSNNQDISGRMTINDGVIATIDTNGNNVVFASTIATGSAQTGGLTKVGLGTLTLAGANSFTGPTTITAGVINYQNGAALGTYSPITAQVGTTVQIQGGITGGAQTLSIAGTGAVGTTGVLENVSGANTYGGAITLGANSTISVDAGTLNLTGPGGITGSGFNLTLTGAGGGSVAGPIATGGGALSKTGSGAWALGASNSYTGPTTISGGSLQLTGGTTQTSAFTFGNGTALSVVNPTTTSPLTLASNLTFGSTSTDLTTLNLNAATDWSHGTGALISVAGALSAFGSAHSTTINISTAATLSVGAYTLISYNGSIGGTGFAAFNLVGLPNSRTIANLVNTGSAIQLNVTSFDSPKWTGAVNGVWDVNTTSNWQLIVHGTSTTYLQGDTVLFDDSATGTTSISLEVPVTPFAVRFGNSGKAYSVTSTTGNGAINGAGVVSIYDGGVVTLALNNGYSGGTNLTSGQLNINAGGTGTTNSAIGVGPFVIGAGTTIDNTSGAAVTVATNNAQTWGGNFTFGGSNPLNLGTGPVTLAGSLTITTINPANPLGVGGTITDNGGNFTLTLAGTGAVSLSGANVYSGGTTLAGGQLNINGVGAIGTGVFTIGTGTTIDNTSGAAVAVTANNPISLPANFTFAGSNPLSLGNGAATLSGNLTITVNGAAALTMNGVIGDNGNGYSLAKAGPGTLVLGGSNTFGGNVFINQGILSITNASALSNATVNLAGGTFNIAYLNTLTPSIPNAISVAMGQSGSFDVTGSGAAGNNLTVSTGPITINGSLTVTRVNGGNGTVNFNSAFAGNGTLFIGNTNAGQPPAAGNMGRAEFLNASNFTNFFGDFHVLNGGNFAFPSTLGGEGGIVNNNNVTIDAGGYMSVNGTTPTASTTLIGGLSGAGTVTTNITTGGMAYLSVGGGDANGNFSGLLAQDQLSATSLLYIIKTGAGTQVFSGLADYSGGTTINGGVLSFANGALGTGPIAFGGNSTLQWFGNNMQDVSSQLRIADGVIATIDTNGNNVFFANAIGVGTAMTGALTKIGLGTLTLGGANLFNGPTTIVAGVIDYQNGVAFGTYSPITVQAGATAQVQGGIAGGSQPMSISGAGASGTTGALENVSGVNSFAGGITLGANSTISSDAGALNLISPLGISGTNVNLTLTGAGNGSIAGAIATGSGALTKSGAGIWSLMGQNTYSGGTTITAGELNINADAALGASTSPLNLSGGSLQFAAGGGVTLGSARPVVLGGGTFDTNGGYNVVASVLSGTDPVNSKLIVIGGGALTLAAVNTYAGSTTVDGATLIVSVGSNISGGALIVNNSNLALPPTSTGLFFYNPAQMVGPLAGTIAQASSGNTASIFLSSSTTLTINQTAAGIFQGNIYGGGNLATGPSSNNTLQLSGNSTYTGTTTINGGTVQLNVSNALPASTALSFAASVGSGTAATLNLNNNNQQIRALSGGSGSSGFIQTGSGVGGILTVVNPAGGSTTFGGVISGNGGLALGLNNTDGPNDTAALVLTGPNSFTGPVTVNSGTLRAGANWVLNGGVVMPTQPPFGPLPTPYPGTFTLAASANASFDLNNFNVAIGSLQGGGPAGGNITLGNGTGSPGTGGTLQIIQSQVTIYAGVISGNGNLIVGSSAGGRLILAGHNTYNGSTYSDVIVIATNNALPTNNNVIFGSGSTDGLDLNGFNQQVSTILGGAATNDGGIGTIVDSASGHSVLTLAYAASNPPPSGSPTAFTGVIANDVNVVIDAAIVGATQTVEFSGPNNTTGALTVGARSNSTSSGVANSLTIDTAASVFSALTIGNGFASNLRNSVTVASSGSLTVGSVTIGDSAAGGTGSNALNVNGPVTVSGAITIGNTISGSTSANSVVVGSGGTLNAGSLVMGGSANPYGVNTVSIASGGALLLSSPTIVGDDAHQKGSGSMIVNGSLGNATAPIAIGGLTIEAGGVLGGSGTVTTSNTGAPIVISQGLVRGGADGTGNNPLGTLTITPASPANAAKANPVTVTGTGTPGLNQTGGILTEVQRTGAGTASASLISILGTNKGLNLNTGGTGGFSAINLVLSDPTGSMVPGEAYTINVAQVFTAGAIRVMNTNQPAGTVIDFSNTAAAQASGTPVVGPSSGQNTNVDLYITGNNNYSNSVASWSLAVDPTGKILQLSLVSSAVPEPEHLLLVCAGALLAGLAIRRRWKGRPVVVIRG